MDVNKILIAVDASENAARAVEYVAQILSGSGKFLVELLHIARGPERDTCPDEETWRALLREEREKMAAFFQKARKTLEEGGIPGKKITERYLEAGGPSIAQAVLKEQQEGGFGTIVIGRRGVSKAEEFLFGSVSNKIVHYAKECTVWVVE